MKTSKTRTQYDWPINVHFAEDPQIIVPIEHFDLVKYENDKEAAKTCLLKIKNSDQQADDRYFKTLYMSRLTRPFMLDILDEPVEAFDEAQGHYTIGKIKVASKRC